MAPTPGIYGWHHGHGGVHFYRMAEPIRVARKHGINAQCGNVLDDQVAERFDTILVHMLWEERATEAWRKLAAHDQHRLIIDVDDVMWSPDWQPFADHYQPDVLQRVYRNIQMAHVVTTPSDVIAEHLSTINPNVFVCPNYVPAYVLSLKPPPRPYPVGPLTPGSDSWASTLSGMLSGSADMPSLGRPMWLAGYQGSPSHIHDFPDWLHRDLLGFLTDRPLWGLHFWGPGRVPGWPRDRVGCTSWSASMGTYYRSLSMDLGIGPLKPSAFNAGKSGLRAVEYAAMGIPSVLSAGPAYDPWVVDGVTGVLVKQGQSWRDVLCELAADPETRTQMGKAAHVIAHEWTTEHNISTWVDAWGSA